VGKKKKGEKPKGVRPEGKETGREQGKKEESTVVRCRAGSGSLGIPDYLCFVQRKKENGIAAVRKGWVMTARGGGKLQGLSPEKKKKVMSDKWG